MLELGLSQADGLKRLFVPQLSGRVNVVGVSDDAQPGRLAAGIGRALIDRGFDVGWEDPAQLLPDNLPGGDSQESARIVIAATNRPEPVIDDGLPRCSLFAARPHPAELTRLYSIMKASDGASGSGAFTVLWCGKGTEDPQMRRLCESNLTETVTRFLNNPVEFVDTPPGSPSVGLTLSKGATEAHFLERLSSMLLNRLGYIRQAPSSMRN